MFETEPARCEHASQVEVTIYHLLLAEEVSVGAAVLHGDAVAFAAHAVARHGDGAVVVGQGGVLQHGHVPQEGVRTLLCLQTNTRGVLFSFFSFFNSFFADSLDATSPLKDPNRNTYHEK